MTPFTFEVEEIGKPEHRIETFVPASTGERCLVGVGESPRDESRCMGSMVDPQQRTILFAGTSLYFELLLVANHSIDHREE